MAVSKALFLEVHTEVAKWRWLVLHWFRQLLRGYGYGLRRLHYEVIGIVGRYRYTNWQNWKRGSTPGKLNSQPVWKRII